MKFYRTTATVKVYLAIILLWMALFIDASEEDQDKIHEDPTSDNFVEESLTNYTKEESNDTPLFPHQTNNMDWFYNFDKETQDNMLSCFNQALQNHKIFDKDVIKIMELKFKITPEQIKNLYEFQKNTPQHQPNNLDWFHYLDQEARDNIVSFMSPEKRNFARLSKKNAKKAIFEKFTTEELTILANWEKDDLHATIKAVYRKRIIFEKFTDKEVEILANKNKDDLYAFIQAEHQKRIDRKLTQAELSQVPDNVYSARHPILKNCNDVIIELEENDTFTIIAKKETQNARTLELTVRLLKNKQENEVFTFWTKKADFHKDFQLIKGDPQVEQENPHLEQENQEFEQRCRDQEFEQDDDQEWEQDHDPEFEQGDSNK